MSNEIFMKVKFIAISLLLEVEVKAERWKQILMYPMKIIIQSSFP